MMAHPIHLHDHVFQVIAIDGRPIQGAVRDTVLVMPMGRVRLAFDAEQSGTMGVALSQSLPHGHRHDDGIQSIRGSMRSPIRLHPVDGLCELFVMKDTDTMLDWNDYRKQLAARRERNRPARPRHDQGIHGPAARLARRRICLARKSRRAHRSRGGRHAALRRLHYGAY